MIGKCAGFMAGWWPLLALALAGWPLYPWYLARIVEEPWHLAPLLGALGLLWSRRSQLGRTAPPVAAAAALALYVLSYSSLPPLLRAGLFAAAVALTASRLFYARALQPGLGALLLLALPSLPSLRMVIGYPLRAASGGIAAFLLRVGGAPATREGAVLRMGEELYSIDAPCSGVAMGWTALLIAAWLAAGADTSAGRALLAVGLAVVLVVLGNAVRAAALVRLDLSPLELPSWSHEAVGLAAFALCAVAILVVVGRAVETRPCEAR